VPASSDHFRALRSSRRRQIQPWWPPRYWGIAARSAFGVHDGGAGRGVMVASGGLAVILYPSLLSGLDDAAGRVADVVAAL
jgi:hypothetical protein